MKMMSIALMACVLTSLCTAGMVVVNAAPHGNNQGAWGSIWDNPPFNANGPAGQMTGMDNAVPGGRRDGNGIQPMQPDINTGRYSSVSSLSYESDSHEIFSSGTAEEGSYRSAMMIPEPATLVILGLGVLPLLRRKK